MLFILLTLTVYCNDSTNALENAVKQAEELTEKLKFSEILNTLTFGISSCFQRLSSSLGIGLAVLLISGIFSCFRDNFSAYAGIFHVTSTLFLIVCSFSIIDGCFTTVESAISALCSYMAAFVPVSATLLSAGGNPITAGSGAVINTFFISAVQIISASLILPCVKSICCIFAVNTLCNKTNLSGITSFFKSSCIWIIGLSFTVFSGILSLRALLASGADNLALKGLKFSAARLIPIAGGMISESLKTVVATVGYIKSVTGIGGVVFIIYTVAIPLCAVITSKLCLFLLSAVAKSANLEKSASLFDGLQGCLNILSALLLGVSVSFIISIGLFIKITVSL